MSQDEPLVIERTINAPAARVWQALTDAKALKQWLPFFPDFKAEVGFRTEFKLGPDAEHQYPHVVEVLEVIDGQRLTYSWDYGGMSPGSSVTFELSAEGDKTRLVLTCHIESIPNDQSDFMENAKKGWTYTADGLKQFVERK
jgi:uncharacterized protein YndB with AHSA1/START domain